MTHEEEMAKLRAETARLRAQNDAWVKKINSQLEDINKAIREI